MDEIWFSHRLSTLEAHLGGKVKLPDRSSFELLEAHCA